jgi:hypothetical protein
MSIVVLLPVLNRPKQAARVVQSLYDSFADARPLFLCSPGDKREIDACQATGAETLIVPFPRKKGDFQRKINFGLHHSHEEWLLIGADDLHFHLRWDAEALKIVRSTSCAVIGTNDLGNTNVMQGRLATHPLVRRDYAIEQGTIDEPGKILHEGYWHNWCDQELTETAQSRGQFAFAPRSHVEHLHYLWGKAEMDSTYTLGLECYEQDRLLLRYRRRLWREQHRAQSIRERAGKRRH